MQEILKVNLKEMSDVLKKLRYRCQCACGKTFIDLDYAKFIQKHDMFDPDKWFIEAVLHFYKTETKHQILVHYPNPDDIFNEKTLIYNLTNDLVARCQQANFADWKAGYRENLKERERVKNKPI
jgi:hypothetical protein